MLRFKKKLLRLFQTMFHPVTPAYRLRRIKAYRILSRHYSLNEQEWPIVSRSDRYEGKHISLVSNTNREENGTYPF